MINSTIIDRARAIPIEGEIERRGIKLGGRVEATGPCPVCGGKDRFAVNTKKQIWNCRGCAKGGDVIALVEHIDGCSFAEAVALLAGESAERQQALQNRREHDREYQEQQARKAAGLWAHRRPIIGSPAEPICARAALAARCLMRRSDSSAEQHPAMIARFGRHDESEPGILGLVRGQVDSVHLTLLRQDGSGKADIAHPKLIVGSPRWRPIELAPANDLLGLAICEGIEDALTAHQATGLGAWAAGAAGFLPAIAKAFPNYIECVTIYAHPDPAGQDGARKLAAALRARGIYEVRIEGRAS